jgi:hypothetical protein
VGVPDSPPDTGLDTLPQGWDHLLDLVPLREQQPSLFAAAQLRTVGPRC